MVCVGIALVAAVGRGAVRAPSSIFAIFFVELLTISILEYVAGPATGSPLFPYTLLPLLAVLSNGWTGTKRMQKVVVADASE